MIWPRNPDGYFAMDYLLLNSGLHSSIKPYVDSDLDHEVLFNESHDTIQSPRDIWKNYYQRTDQHDYVEGGKFGSLVRPIYDVNVGYDFVGKRALIGTSGGVILDADYKQKISIELRVAGGTTVLPNFMDSMAAKSHVMPGWGDRAYSNGDGSYSFQHVSGNLIWRPSKIFNLQVGRDKHFWGDGYRSLFLSDVSGAMPYVKQTTTIWKLQYTSLITWMQDWSIANGISKDFRSKFGTFHYISFNANKWLNIGVFESVIWQGNDSNRKRGFDPNYLNPVVFFRPIEYSLGSSDNAMLGASVKIRFNSKSQFYSQLLLDEFYLKEILAHNRWWANKQGYQIGFKFFDFGHVKNLYVQTEMNIVRPYTYSHGSAQQNYSNAGMPLAHPLGANFLELIEVVSYPYKDFTFTGTFVASRYGLDTAGKDYGQNIFLSYMDRSATNPAMPTDRDYNHKLFDGVRTNMFYAEARASYRLKTAFPIRMELLIGLGNESNRLMTKKSAYMQVGLNLPLWRTYHDN